MVFGWKCRFMDRDTLIYSSNKITHNCEAWKLVFWQSNVLSIIIIIIILFLGPGGVVVW